MIKRYDMHFPNCNSCGCGSDAFYDESESGVFVKYNDIKHLLEQSHNSDYAKLLDKMEQFADDCEKALNDGDAREVRSWVKQLRIIANVVGNSKF